MAPAGGYVTSGQYTADQKKWAEKLETLTKQAQSAYDNSDTALGQSNSAVSAATKAAEAATTAANSVTAMAATVNQVSAEQKADRAWIQCMLPWIWIAVILGLLVAGALYWHWYTGRHRCVMCAGLGCPCCRDHNDPDPKKDEEASAPPTIPAPAPVPVPED